MTPITNVFGCVALAALLLFWPLVGWIEARWLTRIESALVATIERHLTPGQSRVF